MGRFHLTWVGPAAYAEDLVRSRQRICGTYRTGILVLHGLPLPLDRCSDPNTANDLQAVTDWLSSVHAQGPVQEGHLYHPPPLALEDHCELQCPTKRMYFRCSASGYAKLF